MNPVAEFAGGFALGVVLAYGGQPPAAPMPVLDPCQQAQAELLQFKAAAVDLRAENIRLQAQLTALTTPMAKQSLDTERAKLEAALREVLKPPADAVFDWDTLTFKPKGPGK